MARNLEGVCKIIDVAVDHGLLDEQLRITVVDVSRRLVSLLDMHLCSEHRIMMADVVTKLFLPLSLEMCHLPAACSHSELSRFILGLPTYLFVVTIPVTKASWDRVMILSKAAGFVS